MRKLAALVTAAVACLFTFVIVVAAALAGTTNQPSAQATAEIPPYLLNAYVRAARTCPGLPWEVLAAIGFIESRNGDGRVDPATGEVLPPIVGPALDGTDGNARIPDPTEPDGWAHAHGNMQFLKSTWARWGVVAPGRPAGTTPDYNNAYDSIYTAARYLCGNAGRIDNLDTAILRYDPSTSYVTEVLAKAAEYGAVATTGPAGGPIVAGAYTLPVDRSTFGSTRLLDEPAPRLPGGRHSCTQGTPVDAVMRRECRQEEQVPPAAPRRDIPQHPVGSLIRSERDRCALDSAHGA
ncbi:MAG: hypothetical protein ACLPVY_08430 [Acidimicrobiia bacterium]